MIFGLLIFLYVGTGLIKFPQLLIQLMVTFYFLFISYLLLLFFFNDCMHDMSSMWHGEWVYKSGQGGSLIPSQTQLLNFCSILFHNLFMPKF